MSNAERWVLIVDASPAGRAEIRRGAGGAYRCVESDATREAVRACLAREDAPPDCLMLAHAPPECDAPAALGGVDGWPCPVVAVLGEGASGDGPALLRGGVHEIVERVSMTPAGLARAVERAIARFELGRAAPAGHAAVGGASQRLERAVCRAMLDGALISHLVYLDCDFNFVRVNAAYARTCGYAPEAMVGKNHFALYPHPENESIFIQVRDTGIPVEFHDKPFVFPGQPERGVTYWDWTLTPDKTPDGAVRGLVLSLVETTERRRAGQEIVRLNQDLRRRESSCRLLSGIAGRLLTTDDPEAVIGQLCREVMAHLDCQVFINFLLDEDTGRLCLKSCAGLPDALVERIRWLDLDEAVCGRACGADEPPVAEERIRDAFDLRAALLGNYGVQAYCCHPLLADNRIIGLLSFGTRTRADFTDGEADMMRTVADQVALAMQRVESQQVLRESESFYRQMLESIPGKVFTTGPDGHFDYLSQQWADYTGVPIGEQLGNDWNRLLYPDDQARAFAVWQAAVDGRAPYDLEYRVRRHDDVYEWFKVWGRPIRNEAGQIVRWFGTAINIERVKRIELNAQFVNRLAVDLALLTDGDEIFRRVVSGVGDYLGVWRCLVSEVDYPAGVCVVNHDWCRDGSSVTGAYCQDNFAEPEVLATLAAGGAVAIADIQTDPRTADHVAAYEPHRVGALLTVPFLGDSGWQGALTVQSAEPRTWREDEVQLLRSVAGRTWPAVQRARGLAALRASEERLREADRRKDEFLAMLAHELRNPLAPIRNAVHLLKRVATDEPRIAWCRDIIERQADQLTRLVDDLLDVSRITRGKIELKPEPLDVAVIVQRAVEICRPLVDARRHELEIVPVPEPLRVEGDLVRLAQVLSNLLNNAAKYTDEGGRIRVSAGRDNGHAVIRVQDNGRGIDPAALPNLFDLFYQVDRTLDRSEGGLGIGLSLVKRLVDMHGGEVWAYSAGRGKGTEFVIRLPSLPDPSASVEAAPDAAALAEGALRVLVVDDNVDAAESLALLLEIDGHAVSLAHEGQAAVDVALAERPDAVLLDIGLPGLNGYEACRRMRAGGLTDTLIVAMTGYGQEDDRRQSEQAGFDVHLVKPVDLAEIQDLIGRRVAGG
ncbi:ATP-binding protein [Methylomagnum sp.]